MKKVLKFKTARGGRFNNPGHVTFEDFQTMDESNILQEHFYNEDEDKWYEENGEELDFVKNEDGTGYVQIDHEYDTTTFVMEDNLDPKQIGALINADHWNTEEIERILNEYYEEYLD